MRCCCSVHFEHIILASVCKIMKWFWLFNGAKYVLSLCGNNYLKLKWINYNWKAHFNELNNKFHEFNNNSNKIEHQSIILDFAMELSFNQLIKTFWIKHQPNTHNDDEKIKCQLYVELNNNRVGTNLTIVKALNSDQTTWMVN